LFGFRGAYCLKVLAPRAIDPRSGRSAGKRTRFHGSNLLCPFALLFQARALVHVERFKNSVRGPPGSEYRLKTGFSGSVSPKSATNGSGRAWQYSNLGEYRQTANIETVSALT
jgi:hypothetical protein